ncbi:MAG: helix-turn-helix domain-containing protein [Muribaculaceae bacterium]|nr:helix-turn-helix domain-containing protein [Muribaculaceae bacterium]
MIINKSRTVTIIIISLAILTLVAIGIKVYATPNEVIEKYHGQDFAELNATAKRFLTEQKQDSALMVYNIMVSSPDGEKKYPDDLCSAYNNLGYMYFYIYFNYEKAFQCWTKALELIQKYNLGNTQSVYLNLGNMYDFLENEEKSLDYYAQGFEKARYEQKYEELLMIYANMAKAALQAWPQKNIGNKLLDFDLKTIPDSVRMKSFCVDIQNGLSLLANDKRDEAAQALVGSIDKINASDSPDRYAIAVLLGAGKIAMEQNNLSAAIRLHLKADSIALKHHRTDYRAYTNKTLASLYDKVGNKDLSREYLTTAYAISDSIFNISAFNKIHNIETLSEVDEINRILIRKNVETEFQHILLIVMAVALLIIVVFLVQIVRLYRKEKEKNNVLYAKNIEFLELKEEIKADAKAAKYKGSSLSDERRQQLLNKIEEILDSREIFSPNFTIETMAEACSSNKSYVSQVFNEAYNTSFSHKITQLRIEEACRIMRANGSKFTIESIAESVGYRSRSSFSKAFSKETGLTPSDFILRCDSVL